MIFQYLERRTRFQIRAGPRALNPKEAFLVTFCASKK